MPEREERTPEPIDPDGEIYGLNIVLNPDPYVGAIIGENEDEGTIAFLIMGNGYVFPETRIRYTPQGKSIGHLRLPIDTEIALDIEQSPGEERYGQFFNYLWSYNNATELKAYVQEKMQENWEGWGIQDFTFGATGKYQEYQNLLVDFVSKQLGELFAVTSADGSTIPFGKNLPEGETPESLQRLCKDFGLMVGIAAYMSDYIRSELESEDDIDEISFERFREYIEEKKNLSFLKTTFNDAWDKVIDDISEGIEEYINDRGDLYTDFFILEDASTGGVIIQQQEALYPSGGGEPKVTVSSQPLSIRSGETARLQMNDQLDVDITVGEYDISCTLSHTAHRKSNQNKQREIVYPKRLTQEAQGSIADVKKEIDEVVAEHELAKLGEEYSRTDEELRKLQETFILKLTELQGRLRLLLQSNETP